MKVEAHLLRYSRMILLGFYTSDPYDDEGVPILRITDIQKKYSALDGALGSWRLFKHIHIVACSPRSGTTLLHQAMVTCFRTNKHYDHEIRFHLVTAKNNDVVITKRPKDTLYMPGVIDDPNLYVIYVTRDPRDVIVAGTVRARICTTRTLGFGVNCMPVHAHCSATIVFSISGTRIS